MAEDRKLLRVFLGSPGDLPDERAAAKTVIEDINDELSERTGFMVQLDRWEDTPPANERAQGSINKLLEKCDIFVGMLYREWGSPSGEYSSGFEEEFRLSEKRQLVGEDPVIWLFFKKVTDEYQIRNPSQPMKRILEFRDEVKAAFRHKYAEFGSLREFERGLRKALVDQIFDRLSKEVAAKATDEQALLPAPATDNAAPKATGTPFSPEGAAYARHLLSLSEGLAADEKLLPQEVARFRLLGKAVGVAGNDDETLGAHDANLLYLHQPSSPFGRAELVALLEAGVEHFSAENVPLWHWVSQLGVVELAWATIGTSNARSAAAINAISLVGFDLGDQPLKWRIMLHHWLNGDKVVQLAALAYVGRRGTASDVEAVRKLAQGNVADVSNAALEALVRVLWRDSAQEALTELWKYDTSALKSGFIDDIFADLSAVESTVLAKGLEQRNSAIRARVARELRSRGDLSPMTAQKLLADDDQWVRYEALSCLTELGEADALVPRTVLLKPVASVGLGFFNNPFQQNQEGGEAARRFADDDLQGRTDDVLEALVAAHGTATPAYFVLSRRLFARMGTELRQIVREAVNAADDPAAQQQGLRGGLFGQYELEEAKRTLVRSAMDVIAELGGKGDLLLMRSAIDARVADFSPKDVEFLARHGEWKDVDTVLKSYDGQRITNFLMIGASTSTAVVGPLYALGRRRFPELLEKLADRTFLARVIAISADATFAALTDAQIGKLLSSSLDSARRAAALKCVKCLSKARVKVLLDAYKAQSTYFYNVVHWLDMGVSLPRPLAVAAAADELEKLKTD